jgi:hypothetical protein
MLPRYPALLLALTATPVFAQGGGRGRIIDEGTFSVTVASVQRTENFRITRDDNGLITATGQVLAGSEQVTSSLTADSLGTPIKYEIGVRNGTSQTLRVAVNVFSGRMTALSYDQRGDQSMREYHVPAGRCFIVDDDLVHQLYFVAASKHTGPLEIVSPAASHVVRPVLTAIGREPISIGGRSLTAERYSLADGQSRRDFWVDPQGRLLRVEIPSRQLVAVREEPPK